LYLKLFCGRELNSFSRGVRIEKLKRYYLIFIAVSIDDVSQISYLTTAINKLKNSSFYG